MQRPSLSPFGRFRIFGAREGSLFLELAIHLLDLYGAALCAKHLRQRAAFGCVLFRFGPAFCTGAGVFLQRPVLISSSYDRVNLGSFDNFLLLDYGLHINRTSNPTVSFM